MSINEIPQPNPDEREVPAWHYSRAGRLIGTNGIEMGTSEPTAENLAVVREVQAFEMERLGVMNETEPFDPKDFDDLPAWHWRRFGPLQAAKLSDLDPSRG